MKMISNKWTGLIFLVVIILMGTASLFGGVSAEFEARHRFLKQAVIKDDEPAALLTLSQLKMLDKELYRINNYAFLEAWLKAKTGDIKAADAVFQQLLKEDSILKDYIFVELAGLYRKTDPKKAAAYLEKLRSESKDSVLYSDSIRIEAEIYAEKGDFIKARYYYDQWSKKPGGSKIEAQYQNAVLFEKEGNLKEAVKNYRYFITRHKKSDQAAKSLERLVAIEKSGTSSLPKDVDFAYQRGLIAFLHWNFDLSAKYFYDVYISETNNTRRKADSLYYLARTYERAGNYPVATAYYLELLQTFPAGNWEKKAQYQLARVYFLSANENLALNILENLQNDKRSDSFSALSASFLLFQNALANEDEDKALKLSSYISSRFPNKEITRKVQFETAIIHYKRQHYTEAMSIIQKLLSSRNLSQWLKPELLYWKGRVNEGFGKMAEAEDIYLDIIVSYPNDFYRFLAQDRLKLFHIGAKENFYTKMLEAAERDYSDGKERDAKKGLIFVAAVSPYTKMQNAAKERLRTLLGRNPKISKAITLNPYPERPVLRSPLKRDGFNIHFLKASEFAFLGLYTNAAEEFKAYRKGDYNDIEKLYTLASYYSKAGNPNRALYWAESLTRQLGASIDYQLLPEGVRSLLYPREYETIIDAFSKRRGIDKFFVLALIREESKFKPTAMSPQTARGLMQFIPSTARDLASELGLEDFELDRLYSPEFNINLGTQYLANLMKNFNNNPLYVLSAYNSGEVNTKRWKERCSSESPEEFIARIDYPETRNYVKKVMASFRIYKSINAMAQ